MFEPVGSILHDFLLNSVDRERPLDDVVARVPIDCS